MTGLNLGTIFPQRSLYTDDGKLITEETQNYEARNGTQVIATNTATGAATATVYTVPAGKIFYLAHYNLNLCVVTGAAPAFYLKKNASGAAVVIFKFQYTTASVEHSDFINSPLGLPLRFVAGDTIDIQTDTASAVMVGNIMGWLENA